ncbi:hypothetical protein C0995_000067 [Termitomyces sp. Mi166|nr:hypothetical protein C0995_000067 [Termitomyces sp. Mi166\
MHKRAILACKSPHDTQSLLGLVSRRFNHASYPQDQRIPSSKTRLAVSRKAYDKVKKDTLKIINRAMFQPPDFNDTPTLRGKEKTLAAILKVNSPGDRKSLEQEAFENVESDEDEELGGTDDSDASYPPATFIETRRSLITGHGVILGEQFVERRKKYITLMNTGEVWDPGRQDVLFAFPNFIPLDLAERCGLERSAVTPIQTNARVEVLRRLRDMERKAEVTHNIVSLKSVNIYQQLKSPDPDAWNTVTLPEVARLISSKPDEMTHFGVHKYVMSNSIYFVADQSYQTNRIINVRPQSHIQNINQIKKWMRIPDGPIQSFAAKVKEITPKNQQTQDATRAELPSYAPATHVWTDTDRAILKFLHNSLRQTRTNQSDPYSLGLSYILKQIAPGKPVESSDLYETLVNIGALAPWQDLACLDPAIALDIEPQPTSSWIQKQEAIATKGFASMAPSETESPPGPEDFHRTDPLEPVRHDFGDLPVFVIDDASAQELDDGLSIERIPSEPDNFWVHVHVADPASLIPPTHILAKEASTHTISIYLTHRTWPLFPKTLMSHPTLGLSLGRKTDKSPLRVLTFSGKVDASGQLLDYKVRAGIINNVNVITYDQVNEIIGHSTDLSWYPFGRKIPSRLKSANLPDSYVKDLLNLQEVARRLMTKRYKDGIILAAKNVAFLEPIVGPPPEIFGPVYEPKTFRGFPTFQYSVMTASDQDSGSQLMVAESMKLACRIASRFCTEHNLPAMRRFSDPLSVSFSGDIQDILDMRTPNCIVPLHRILDRIQSPAKSGYSMEPRAHYPLGVADGEGYTRVTSPLRRYIDLVVHWQIHHALLGSKASKPSPPFNAEEIWAITKTASAHEQGISIMERVHLRFWHLMFIKRWAQEHGNFDTPNAPLGNLKVFTLSVVNANYRTGGFQVQVDCPYLGIYGMLENPNPDLPCGSEVEVRIRDIVLGPRPQVYFIPKN